jgi:hypothetical protein
MRIFALALLFRPSAPAQAIRKARGGSYTISRLRAPRTATRFSVAAVAKQHVVHVDPALGRAAMLSFGFLFLL